MLWKLRNVLADHALSRTRLYLDQRYWNDLCDGLLGTNKAAVSYLQLFHESVDRGELICPGGALALSELADQSVERKRHATAEVMDLLCDGVALVAPPDRLFLEVLRFIQACPMGPPFPSAPIEEVWTAPAFVYGHEGVPMVPDSLPQADRLNAGLIEQYAAVSHLEIVHSGGLAPFQFKLKSAARLNESKEVTRQKFKSFRELYLAEVRGMLDLAASDLGNAIVYSASRAGLDVTELSPDKPIESGRALARVLHSAFEEDDLGRQLPSVHIPATLFARVQWDVPRRYAPNDFADFMNAAAALPYCDAFATERSLAALLEDAGLVDEFDCTVLTGWDALLEWKESVVDVS